MWTLKLALIITSYQCQFNISDNKENYRLFHAVVCGNHTMGITLKNKVDTLRSKWIRLDKCQCSLIAVKNDRIEVLDLEIPGTEVFILPTKCRLCFVVSYQSPRLIRKS